MPTIKIYRDLRLTQGTKAWLQFRESGIGGSEIASVLASDSTELADLVWTPPLKLWLEKIGEPVQPFMGNLVTEEGKYQERAIVERFKYFDLERPDALQMHKNRQAKLVRNQVRNHNGVFQNSQWDWLFYSPDSLYMKEGKRYGILESKLTTSNETKRYANKVNPSHYLQVMMGLMLTGLPIGYVLLLVDGQWFEAVPVEPDKEVFEWIETISAQFWKTVIQARKIKLEYDIDYYTGRNPDTLNTKQQEGAFMLSQLEPDLTGSTREIEFIKQMIVPQVEEVVREGSQEEWKAVLDYVKAGLAEDGAKHLKNKAYAKMLSDLQGFNKIDFGKEVGFYSYKPDKNGQSRLYVSPKIK